MAPLERGAGVGIRRSKTGVELGGHGIFGDEDAAQIRSEVDDLRTQFIALCERVNAQFTSIAAHAEIAREQVEIAREEARADMERSRDTLIGLIETVRGEALAATGHHVPGLAPGPSTSTAVGRIEAVESAVDELRMMVESCLVRHQRMGDTMAAFIDTMLAETRGEPVMGLSLV
jgi:hypothetical protein